MLEHTQANDFHDGKEVQAEGGVEGETEGELTAEGGVTSGEVVTTEVVVEEERDGADKVEAGVAATVHVESTAGDGSSGSGGGDARTAAVEVFETAMVEPAELATAAEGIYTEGGHAQTADTSEAADAPESTAAVAAAAVVGAATAAAAAGAAASAAGDTREPSEEELIQRAMAMSLNEERETAAIKAVAGSAGGGIGETLNPYPLSQTRIQNLLPKSKTQNPKP
jgi:hypothetical protein